MTEKRHDEFDIDAILLEVEQRCNASKEPEIVFLPFNEYVFSENKVRFKDNFFSWVDTLFCSIAAAMLVLIFLFRMNVVVGESMEPTLYENDRLILFQLGYEPQYGDIVAIRADNIPNQLTGDMGELIIKRVIGLEGDVIDIDEASGTVYRNGEALDEPYIAEAIDAAHLGNVIYPVTVEENCIFVLGDNRNHSLDSRVADNGYTDAFVGCINENFVLGKAVLRIWPPERFGVL